MNFLACTKRKSEFSSLPPNHGGQPGVQPNFFLGQSRFQAIRLFRETFQLQKMNKRTHGEKLGFFSI